MSAFKFVLTLSIIGNIIPIIDNILPKCEVKKSV